MALSQSVLSELLDAFRAGEGVDLVARRNAADDAELAAVAFLARYSGRTLDAYRHDLRSFFDWAVRSRSKCSPPLARTSSCTATTWNNAA